MVLWVLFAPCLASGLGVASSTMSMEWVSVSGVINFRLETVIIPSWCALCLGWVYVF